ncbi:MAG TPA: GNAT family N-acetyltransferase [Actinomycetales bacterium]|nr:GNAT family N-acetyltransferase [Actinomycetales bacterium]
MTEADGRDQRDGGYDLDDDRARVDVDAAWDFLVSDAYWGRWRTKDDFRRQVASAWRVVGCYDGDGRMVGFARAWSDGVASAYLADVYVLTEHRGRGLGSALVRTMVDEGPGRDFRWMLHTADAHPLYRRHGFSEPDDTYLERPSRRAH